MATWTNWSGSVQCTPREIAKPASEAELIALVQDARRRGLGVRVVGSGHSFTPLVATAGVLVSLDQYSGILAVDRATWQATVRAGTKLRELGAALFTHHLAQVNLGDIDEQSIAGAISTGTHGTGIRLGSISTQVIALRLITADGGVLECSADENPDIFKAAQVSLGSLGIISTVTLQLQPAYRLHYVWQPAPLDETLARLESYRSEHRHFEFYWVPYTTATMVKLMDPTDAPTAANGRFWPWVQAMVLENGALWALSEVCRLFPAQVPRVANLIGSMITGGSDVKQSHEMFATPRLVRFQEMEYSFHAEQMADVLREIDACVREQQIAVHFPVECRFVHGDDIWLSPAHGRDSAYIAVHMYRGMPYQPYFSAIEAIFRRYNGRPHWGKLHTRRANELQALYPQWDAFQCVRRQLDPQGVFLNPYLRSLFEEDMA